MRRVLRGLFDQDVSVGAPGAQRRYPGDARRRPGPGLQGGVDEERGLGEVELGAGPREVDAGGICLCVSAITVLMKPAIPAASPRWPMLAFTEPMRAVAALVGRLAKRLRQRLDLDRIADRRAGSVRLDVS